MSASGISSRTPDGVPGRCPICRAEVHATPATELDDMPCPACGTLIWPVGGSDDSLPLYLIADELTPEKRAILVHALEQAADPNADSLDEVEAVMEVEDTLDISISDELAEQLFAQFKRRR